MPIPFSSYDKVSREMYGDQTSVEPLPMTMRSRTIASSTFVDVTKSTTNTHNQLSKFWSWWPTIIYHLMHLKCHSCYNIAIYGLSSSNSCKLYHPFIYFMELARVKCTCTMDNEYIFVMTLEEIPTLEYLLSHQSDGLAKKACHNFSGSLAPGDPFFVKATSNPSSVEQAYKFDTWSEQEQKIEENLSQSN